MKHALRLLALFIALFAFGLYAQIPAPYALDKGAIMKAAATVTPQRFPESHLALVDDLQYVKYEIGGKEQSWDDMAYKILTEQGKDSMRTLSTVYNTAYGKAAFLRISIIKPDETVIDLPVDKITKEMTNTSNMSSNIYDPNSKRLTATIPELEIGDIVHYCVYRETSKPRYPRYSDIFILEDSDPIIHYTILVDGPKDEPLKAIALRNEIPHTVEHSVTKKDDRIIHRWEVNNVPPMIPEPRMPGYMLSAQRLLISCDDSWEDVSKWYWELCAPKLYPSPEMEAKVKELTHGLSKEEDIVRAIFKFVSQEIRYMGVIAEDTAPGFEPHDVSLTFSKRHGVCRDKAALLAAMLRVAKIEAYPVLIMAGDKLDEEIPLLHFNHAVTTAKINGEYMLMDSTDETTRDLFPAYLQNRSYLVAHPDGETLRVSPYSPASENMVSITTDATLNDQGILKATATLQFSGINDNAYRSTFLGNDIPAKTVMEKMLGRALPNVRVQSLKITPENLQDTSVPLQIEITFTADCHIVVGETVTLMTPPLLVGRFGMANVVLSSTTLDKRKYTYLAKYACGVKEHMVLHIDPAFGTLKSVPKFTNVDDSTISWSRNVDVDDQDVVIDSAFSVNSIEFSPDQYLTFKGHLKTLEDNNRKKLIFKHDKKASAAKRENDAEVLEANTDIVLKDDHTWTVTNTVKEKILTYKGMKDLAEIIVGYNPVWEKATLKYARVTNTVNGTPKVTEISPREINLMDAEWVSDAPRYPAGKQLVISFPAVGIGSVIEYQIEFTSEKQPFFSYSTFFQADSIPIHSKQVTINAPAALAPHLDKEVMGQGIMNKTPHPFNPPVTREVKTQDGRVIYTWHTKEQPAYQSDSQQPPRMAFLPALYLSTADENTYVKTLSDAFNAKTVTCQAVDKIAESLKKYPPEEQLKRVNEFVSRTITLAGPNFTSLPLDCLTPPEKTLADGYANRADTAILFAAILRKLGFKAEYVFASDISFPELFLTLSLEPTSSLYDIVLVRVTHDKKTYWFNDKNQYAELQTTPYNGRFGTPEGNTAKVFQISVPKNYRTATRSERVITLMDDGSAPWMTRLAYTGTNFASEKQNTKEQTPEDRRREHLAQLNGISQKAVPNGSYVKNFDAYPGTITYACTVPNFTVKNDKMIYFKLPFNPFAGSYINPAKDRQVPIAFYNYTRKENVITINLPKNIQKILLKPQTKIWYLPDNESFYSLKVEQPAPDKLVCTYTIDLKPALYPAAVLESFRTIARELDSEATRTFILEQ